MSLPVPQAQFQIHLHSRGHQAIWWSTDHRLAVPGSGFAWDVRGYYRTLGIGFPYVDATKRDLSLGYIAANGEADHWATYCMGQLLSHDVRRRYDAVGLGEDFPDLYTQMEARDAQMRARAQQGQSVASEDDPDGDTEGESQRMLDIDPSRGHDDRAVPAEADDYPYGVFVNSFDAVQIDPSALSLWQSLIRQEARDMSHRAEVALGILRDAPDWTVGQVEGRAVVLLGSGHAPNRWDAHRIVRALSEG